MAADMLVAREIKGEKDVKEFVAIERSDTGLFALPGGMVDSTAELFKSAAIREFFEEAAADNETEKELIGNKKQKHNCKCELCNFVFYFKSISFTFRVDGKRIERNLCRLC
jgi:8-oxo-dGTP pyrophosphatase MutT (NUDIX family)